MVRIFLIDGLGWIPEWRFYCLTLSTILIAAAGYIINDYYDVKIDLINKPQQLMVGKSFSRRNAIIFHFTLNFLGILIGFLASWKIALLNTCCAFLLWLYSNRLKQLPLWGNVTVAFLTALSIIIMALYYHQFDSFIFLFALYAFFMTLVREIVKDMEDMKGDAAFGCRTLPIEIGLRPTKKVIYLILILLVGSYLTLSIYFELYSIPYLVYSVSMLLMIGRLGYKLFMADTKKEFTQLSNFSKLIMVLGVLGIAFI